MVHMLVLPRPYLTALLWVCDRQAIWLLEAKNQIFNYSSDEVDFWAGGESRTSLINFSNKPTSMGCKTFKIIEILNQSPWNLKLNHKHIGKQSNRKATWQLIQGS